MIIWETKPDYTGSVMVVDFKNNHPIMCSPVTMAEAMQVCNMPIVHGITRKNKHRHIQR